MNKMPRSNQIALGVMIVAFVIKMLTPKEQVTIRVVCSIIILSIAVWSITRFVRASSRK